MEQPRQTNGHWSAAWLAAVRYMSLAGVTAYGTWLTGVQDKWDSLTSYDYLTCGVAVATAVLTALGAIMNDRWSNARKETNGTNG